MNKKKILLNILFIIIAVLYGCNDNKKDDKRIDVDSILYPGDFSYEDLAYEPLYASKQWMDEQGKLLFPYEKDMSLMSGIDDAKASFLIPEDVLVKASTKELLKVAYEGWLSTHSTSAYAYDRPSYFISFCAAGTPACNEIIRRSDMVEIIFEDYCQRSYKNNKDYSEEACFEVNKLQFAEILLGSNHAFSMMDDTMKTKVLNEVLKKNQEIHSGDYYTCDLLSGFFAIIEEEYYNGGSQWYTYIYENSVEEAKKYINIDENIESSLPNWKIIG